MMATVTVSTTRNLVRIIVVGGPVHPVMQTHEFLGEWWIDVEGHVTNIMGGRGVPSD